MDNSSPPPELPAAVTATPFPSVGSPADQAPTPSIYLALSLEIISPLSAIPVTPDGTRPIHHLVAVWPQNPAPCHLVSILGDDGKQRELLEFVFFSL